MSAPGQKGVSILMATYNGAAYINEQLRSILAQAAPEDEVIVVDDCSTDETPAILARYVEHFPNVQIVQSPRNAGVRATFETLLGLARRDVILLSDQDDIWMEGRKARMVKALESEGCVAVLANALILTEQGIGRPFFPSKPNVGSVTSNFTHNNFIGCCMAFRREVLEIALPFPPAISMHDWWLGTCAMAIGKVRYLDTPSLLYRRHGANQSSATRRRWSVVLRDRRGNLLALMALARRLARWRQRER